MQRENGTWFVRATQSFAQSQYIGPFISETAAYDWIIHGASEYFQEIKRAVEQPVLHFDDCPASQSHPRFRVLSLIQEVVTPRARCAASFKLFDGTCQDFAEHWIIPFQRFRED